MLMPLFSFSWRYILILLLSVNLCKIYCLSETKFSYKDDCISVVKSSVGVDRSYKNINLEVQWSIVQEEQKGLAGFLLSCITGNGRSMTWELSKKTMQFALPLPLKALALQKYTFSVDCISKRKSNPKSVIIKPEDFCRVLRTNGIQSPYHCLPQLENVHVHKCVSKQIIISWKKPNVTGYGKYSIRHSLVECKDNPSCCSMTDFKEEFQVPKDRNNFSYIEVAGNRQHCFEILMCPETTNDNINCEIKHSPFLVDCKKVKKQHQYFLIFGITAAVTVILGIIFIRLWNQKKTKQKELNANLLTEIKDFQSDYIKNESKTEISHKAPILFIIFCAGCNAVEDFVINLIHILRLNGVDAVSELTEEENVQKFGRGVYLNERLKDADFVMVLCTEDYSSQSRAMCQNLYFYALNVIQNRVIEHGGDLSRYIMLHLGQPCFIPESLRPANIDLGCELHEVLQCLLRRLFGVNSFHLGQNGPKKNEVSLENDTGDNIEILSKCRNRIMAEKHAKCSLDNCKKGKKSSGKWTVKML